MVTVASKKFTINDRLELLPKKESIILRRTIAKLLGKSREQTSRILNATEDSTLELPARVVIQLSNYFGCSPDEIYTNPPKPISQKELESASNNHIAKGLGLVK